MSNRFHTNVSFKGETSKGEAQDVTTSMWSSCHKRLVCLS